MREHGRTVRSLLIVLALGLGGRVWAAIVFCGASYDPANDWYVYRYSLENPSTATDQLYWFELRGIGGSDALDVTPGGWTGALLGSDIDWLADVGSEVAPGGSLTGFSFHSARGPGGSLSYDVLGDVDSHDWGTIDGPSAVPEPSLGLLLLVAIVPLGVLHRRRRPSAATN